MALNSLEIWGGGKLKAEYDDGELLYNHPAVTVNAAVSHSLVTSQESRPLV